MSYDEWKLATPPEYSDEPTSADTHDSECVCADCEEADAYAWEQPALSELIDEEEFRS